MGPRDNWSLACHAHHPVCIRDGDEWKTAFNTPRGHYEYLIIPTGLNNAPAAFQNLINDLLRDTIAKFVFVYFDDILIFSCTLEDHVLHVRQMLQRFLENCLFIKGHGLRVPPSIHPETEMDPEKTRFVTEWPTPDNRKELQRFLGFTHFYRRFRRNYSSVGAPRTTLTSSKTIFYWTPRARLVLLFLCCYSDSAKP